MNKKLVKGKKNFSSSLNNGIKKIALNFFIIFVLSSLFVLFVLNSQTQKYNLGNAYEFLGHLLVKERIFHPADFGHQIGHQVSADNYTAKEVILVSPADYQNNGQNYLYIGPGIYLFPGKYHLNFDLALNNAPANVEIATIDVCQTAGQNWASAVINSAQFRGEKFNQFELEFETTGGKLFEFRILYFGEGELMAGDVKLKTLHTDYKSFPHKFIKMVKRLFKAS